MGQKSLGTATLSGSGGTATASLNVAGSQLAIGANTISVSYGGSTSFAPSSTTLAVAVTDSGLLSGIVTYKVVTTQAPASTGCTRPPPATSFLTTSNTIYLYFEATVTTSDSLSNDWLAPDNTVVADQLEPGFRHLLLHWG